MAKDSIKIILRPVADSYASPGERIIEYSASSIGAGGLISFRVDDQGYLTVDLYRHDANVQIRVGEGS